MGGDVERRAHMRRRLTVEASGEGVDDAGVAFECAALLHDIGAGGACLRVAHRTREGSEMTLHLGRPPGPYVSARGRVLRVVPQPLETCDVAVRFDRQIDLSRF